MTVIVVIAAVFIFFKIIGKCSKPEKEVIKDFFKSKTGKALYDASTNLWCNGPSYIADMYLEEKKAVAI